MPQGGETPGIEQVPQLPDRAIEAPVEGASFEAQPAPAPEQPAAPVPAAPAPAPRVAAPAPKDPVVKQVESVLEEGLGDAYQKMKPDLQRKFRTEGEKTVGAIAEMVRSAKVQARTVLSLITRWLRIIPGVNRFFLDQEAKIKTDKIVALAAKDKLP